ncbi:MFS transporter [Streptomyces sp. NPDC127068]|uniref:MFS transporter n=1 Tax=Streptomyces sp. NPDC127068 TaxID=3347127 RepID=UPI0036513ECB
MPEHSTRPARDADGRDTAAAARPRATDRGAVPVLWLVLLATPTAAGANTVVLTLPDVAAAFDATVPTAAWLVTVFAVAMAVGTPLVAGLLRRRGLRAALRLSAALLAGGTLLIAVAPWLPLVLAGRAAQGAGGAGLVTVAMSLAGTTRRMGVLTAGFGSLGAAGPLVGAQLSDAVSWRLALAVSAVTLLAVPAVARYARPAPRAEGPFDARGAALLAVLASALALIPALPAPALLAAGASAVLLAVHVRRRPDGFVPLSVLRSRTFTLSCALIAVFSTQYFVLLFAVPRLMADRAGWSTQAIGTGQLVALVTGSALSWLLAAAAHRLSRTAIRTFLLAVTATALTTAALARSPWPLLVVAGASVFTATAGNANLSVHAAGAAPEPLRPTAIGLFTLTYQLGGAIGPGIATALVLS